MSWVPKWAGKELDNGEDYKRDSYLPRCQVMRLANTELANEPPTKIGLQVRTEWHSCLSPAYEP